MTQLAKPRIARMLIGLGMLLLLVSTGVPTAVARAALVPMRGEFSGAGEIFSGNATHLGRFAGVIDNTSMPPNALWTAANGDTIANITTGFVIDFSAPVAPNVYPYTQTIEFMGGTGRFQNAAGNATITGTIDIVTFAYDGRISGSLSRPNSN